jgi:hypothetical protein
MYWMRRLCFMVLQVERVVMCSNGGLDFEQISKLSFANFVLGTSKGGLLENGHVYHVKAPLKPLFISDLQSMEVAGTSYVMWHSVYSRLASFALAEGISKNNTHVQPVFCFLAVIDVV